MADKQADRPSFLTADNRYMLLLPVTYKEGDDERTLDQLKLRRLTGADLLRIDEQPTMNLKLLATIEAQTGLLRVVTGKIDAVDLDRIDDIFGYFRTPGSVIGAIS